MFRGICIACTAVAVCVGASAEPPGLILNEDDSHFFGSRTADDMTTEGLHAFVDQYAGTKVSHLFLCPNAMRTSYDSEVWDAIWELGEQVVPQDSEFAKKWIDNARILHERALDPYAVWIARCREKGISPWLSMRMNDLHDVDNPSSYLHSTFWLQHPEFRRVPENPKSWFDRAFDYGHPEVREHHMKLLRELFERYDADGIELDWMRFGYHFRPGQEAQGRAILTEFMREARRLASEASANRGHPVRIAARVPAHPDAAVGLGMDGAEWAREGLIDILVPTPFWATADFDIPLELWRERLGAAAEKVVLAPGMEVLVRAYPAAEATLNDIEAVRGFAAAAWHRGADQLYFFNYMDPAPMAGGPAAYRTLLEQGLAPETVAKAPRRHVVTYRDTVPEGVPSGIVLPAEAAEGATFRIHTGPVPSEGAKVTVVAGLGDREESAKAEFDVTVNGEACAPAADAADTAPYPGAKRAVRFDCPLPALRAGYNEVAVRQRPGAAPQQLVWMEIRIAP